MKTLKILLFLIAFSFLETGISQTTFQGSPINASEVPEQVKNSFESEFPNTNVKRWKYQKATGKRGNEASAYIAVFKGANKLQRRARFRPEGTLIYFQENFTSRSIPEILKSDLSENFSSHRVMSGIFIKLYDTNKEFYRIRLKKGATIVIVYYDKSGEQVDRSDLPSDI